MQIVDSTVSLTVADVAVTARFLIEHFGYVEAITADGFVSVTHPGGGVGVAIHRLGLEVLPEDQRDVASRGVVLAFTVADAAAEEARLRAAGVEFTLPLTAQPWGERLFQVADGNGVIVQVLDWAEQAG
ncbi:VOC family protein [Nocardia thailandica]|uniref:VOC family protein n=1 Tax=Nocardia thailandica TaxID=257275 RepID=A0ABW6PKL5_9NOCA